jgi:hypothetical protein
MISRGGSYLGGFILMNSRGEPNLRGLYVGRWRTPNLERGSVSRDNFYGSSRSNTNILLVYLCF